MPTPDTTATRPIPTARAGTTLPATRCPTPVSPESPSSCWRWQYRRWLSLSSRYGIGKVINTAIVKHDGPLNKWNAAASGQITQKNMASDAQLEQEQLQQMTQNFPTPRLQIDDGDQDITDLHAREDLLLDHYSWVDQQHGKVRIPIARAMELIAQQGLPVVPGAPSEPLMTADTEPTVTAPLTNGFARTGYEQEALTTMQQQRARGEASGEQAALGTSR